jgi:hypothetical protein
MDRRHFLINSIVGCSSIGLARHVKGDTNSATPRKLRVQYIRKEAPAFDIPVYRGQSYADTVPDTLDIAERCRLGVNALTAIADPEADYEIYGAADFFRNPSAMMHDFNDWVQNQEGFMEALPLLRLASGESLNNQVDPVWMRTTLQSIGPDGLVYVPLEGRPWARLHSDGVSPVWTADGRTISFKDPAVTQIANVSTCQRIIGTMTIYYLRDRNPMWRAAIEKMIARLSALAIARQDYCYYTAGSYEPGARIDPKATMPIGSTWGVSWNSRLIQGLAQYYRVTGYEPAQILAEKLVNYTRYHGEVFEPDGPWLLDPEFRGKMDFPDYAVPDWVKEKYYKQGLKLGGHGHGHGIALLSVLEYATATGNRDLLQFCKASFEWARSPGADYGVSTVVGWFPEFYAPAYPSADADPQGDMVAVALKLSGAGAGDYWDDIDRWVRNQYVEQQLTSVDYLYRLAGRSPSKPVAWNESADHVPEKSLGGFGSSVSGNDWALGLASTGIAQCCTGTNTRTLYYIWDRMLDHQEGQLKIHLLLNRASRWADVYSYIPYQGRVDLKMKENCGTVKVRAPEWIGAQSPELLCKVNDAKRLLNWEGRYINLGSLKVGDKVRIDFPIQERTIKERIGPETYSLVVKGNTVVSIDPPGKNVPLYADRAKYRTADVRWKKVNRFVSEEEIRW